MTDCPSLNSRLITNLSCPVCYNYLNKEIYICSNGHSFCSDCFARLTHCGLCKTLLCGFSRNFGLESIAELLKYPCENKRFGCTDLHFPSNLETHSTLCPFRIYDCILDNCFWKGRLFEIEKHFKLKHKSFLSYGKKILCRFEMGDEGLDDEKQLIIVDSEKFMLRRWLYEGNMLFSVHFLGNVDEAANYHFEIELFSDEFPYKKIKFSDYCFNDLFDAEDNIMITDARSDESTVEKLPVNVGIPEEVFKSFADGTNTVHYHVTIDSN